MIRTLLLLSIVLFLGCGETEPRKPIQVKSGSFYENSIERSKKLLQQEEQLILAFIQRDSMNSYAISNNGFWYKYETKNETSDYELKTDDEVLLTYTLMSFNNDTLYSSDNIGVVQHAIDKSQLFPGLRNAVKLLKEGEKATFLFPSSQAYGYKGDDKKIGPKTPIISSLELLKILNKKDSLN